ncbi:NAD(+) diphosphatase [Microbacterium sp. SLBN-146]|uniref:NAD(+) diphosphatase n=1 Tax=Microbacterium sp. SLBN-146 TaxID=2768457 RepID=UPI0011509248|nr:NAD(+) diphosphatase [Microbacterium sp. SLBN-146]TQJ31770.1 NAD+ diphosphatase [Microbacterium sp. SLBN-146]
MTLSDTASGGPANFDRAAEERTTTDLTEARTDASVRVLVVAGDAAPLSAPDRLLWVPPSDVPDDATWAFLGRSGEGERLLLAALPAAESDVFPAPAGWASLRTAAPALSSEEAGAFVAGLSLSRWLLDSPFCAACGTRCDIRDAGWSRRCPACGRQHFPRTDPAVIVAITSAADPDALLLGSNVLWGPDRFSCFAGFAEAGESLESAVHREVLEESGVAVTDVRYRGSQAWPFPRSLMVGFLATAVDDAAARADGEEIATLRWFSRAEIGAGLAGESALRLPGPASISHRLISDWYAGNA